jgi:hypothetical protein
MRGGGAWQPLTEVWSRYLRQKPAGANHWTEVGGRPPVTVPRRRLPKWGKPLRLAAAYLGP